MRIFYSLLCYAFAIVSFARSGNTIDSVVIRQVPWNILTVAGVSCQEFERSFAYDEFCITDKKKIKKLIGRMNKLKRTTSGFMDVRCKICFYSADTLKQVCCMDYYNVWYEGEMYAVPPKLHKLLKTLEHDGTPVKTDHSSFGGISDFPYTNGKDSLWSFIHSKYLSNSYMITDTLNVIALCRINYLGETIDTEIRIKNDSSQSAILLKNELANILKRDIKWNSQAVEYPDEFILIPIKLYPAMNESDNVLKCVCGFPFKAGAGNYFGLWKDGNKKTAESQGGSCEGSGSLIRSEK